MRVLDSPIKSGGVVVGEDRFQRDRQRHGEGRVRSYRLGMTMYGSDLDHALEGVVHALKRDVHRACP